MHLAIKITGELKLLMKNVTFIDLDNISFICGFMNYILLILGSLILKINFILNPFYF